MPNPRITFRVTPELLEQLPQDAEERSQFVIDAIQAKLNPPAPESEVGDLLQRIETVEDAMIVVLEKLEKLQRSSPQEPIDKAIKATLERIKPSQRRDAAKLFNQLQKFVSGDSATV